MYVMNVTEYVNMTDDYNDSLSINNICTDNVKNIDKLIQTRLITTSCGISFLCLMSLML